MIKHQAYWVEAIITLILALGVVSTRLACRAMRVGYKNLELDDYLMFLAAMMLATMNALYAWETFANHGYNNFMWNPENLSWWHPTPEEMKMMTQGSQVMLAYAFLYNFLMWTTKLCMCFLYWRVLSCGPSGLRRLVQFSFVVIAVTFVGATVTFFAACRPFSGFWQLPSPASVECSPAFGPVVRAVPPILNICADLYLIIPPAIMIWHVKASRDRKMTLCVIFGISLALTVLATLRLSLPYTTDPGLRAHIIVEWAGRECWAALITSNVPVLFGELNKLGVFDWFRKLFGMPTSSPADQDPEAGNEAHMLEPVPEVPGNAEQRAPSSQSRVSRFTEDLEENPTRLPNVKDSRTSFGSENTGQSTIHSTYDQRVIVPREAV
ncbi:hypothetical protein IWX90DRAFT_102507 [Phyllosticta citrichinensis]|uniref:Rhodopsin domain-containing protein n=1 Tax=Phyllosticta citrichinensis TaxID=1130410 RepID=A0ABR1Y2C0_9PEZI